MTLSSREIKYYSSLRQKKHREKEGKFLIEGVHLVEECLNSSFFIESIAVRENVDEEKIMELINEAGKKQIAVYFLKAGLFNKLTETESSQGIAAIVHKKKDNNHNVLTGYKTVLALDRVTDPGNLGTIIRTAYWFGTDCVLLGEDSVDLYNSKVIRSTQGAMFHIDVRTHVKLTEILRGLRTNGFDVFLFSLSGKQNLPESKAGRKNVLVFGNETEGISRDLFNYGFNNVKIEGYSNCESLNIAVSCGIALYEFKKRLNELG
jgi:TrmH family RNA methyltransferase